MTKGFAEDWLAAKYADQDKREVRSGRWQWFWTVLGWIASNAPALLTAVGGLGGLAAFITKLVGFGERRKVARPLCACRKWTVRVQLGEPATASDGAPVFNAPAGLFLVLRGLPAGTDGVLLPHAGKEAGVMRA
jgi:hypothetical protein